METVEQISKLVALLNSKKSALELTLSRSLEKMGVELINLGFNETNWGFIVSLKIKNFRDKIENISLVFSPSRVLHSDKILALGTEFNINRFCFNSDCGVEDVSKMVRVYVGMIISGYRRERLACSYFEKLKKTFPAICGVRLSTKEEDGRAIDIVVDVRYSREIHGQVPIQVKSKIEHQELHRQNLIKGRIPSILIPKRYAYEALAPLMKKLIHEYIVNKKAIHVRIVKCPPGF